MAGSVIYSFLFFRQSGKLNGGIFLSVVSFVPSGVVYSNTTRVGASRAAGRPVDERMVRLQMAVSSLARPASRVRSASACCIRVNDAGRHEYRNDNNLLF